MSDYPRPIRSAARVLECYNLYRKEFEKQNKPNLQSKISKMLPDLTQKCVDNCVKSIDFDFTAQDWDQYKEDYTQWMNEIVNMWGYEIVLSTKTSPFWSKSIYLTLRVRDPIV